MLQWENNFKQVSDRVMQHLQKKIEQGLPETASRLVTNLPLGDGKRLVRSARIIETASNEKRVRIVLESIRPLSQEQLRTECQRALGQVSGSPPPTEGGV